MHQATVKRISFGRLAQDGRDDEARTLFFDDAAWVISSPLVNVTQKLVDDARKNRPETMFAGKTILTEPADGEYVPVTISREQAAFRRVQRAVANYRTFGNNHTWGSKPF